MSAKILCPPEQIDQERRFFDALAAARKIQASGDRLALLDEKGSDDRSIQKGDAADAKALSEAQAT